MKSLTGSEYVGFGAIGLVDGKESTANGLLTSANEAVVKSQEENKSIPSLDGCSRLKTEDLLTKSLPVIQIILKQLLVK